jgi:flagellar basal-body rod protein FlgB
MSSLLFDSLYKGLESVLDLRSQQHGLSATNLANADTPGFKAKVMHFEELLGSAVDRASRLQPAQTHALHMPGHIGNTDNPAVDELEAPPWRVDGNSVFPEREMTRLTENSLLFGAVARGLNIRMKILRFAASDGKA